MSGPFRPERHPPATWDAAMSISADAAPRLRSEIVSLAEAVGRVAARDLHAAQAIPHYVSSAMDGWAVAGDPPWSLLPAGDEALAPGTARSIVTGGVVPAGTAAVLRTEHGALAEGMLRPREPFGTPVAGADIRPAGEEAAAGEVLITAGTLLNPAHAAVAAACAHDRVEVVALPRVRLVLTGDEVVESGLPAPGRVRDSFGPMLPAFLRGLGGTVTAAQRVADDLDATIAAFGRGDDSELIITTGGTGGSHADHVRAALDALGAEVLVPSIAVRPGGPAMLARLPDGRLVAGVAGNPLAAIVGLLLVAAPTIATQGGRSLLHAVELVAATRIPRRSAGTSMVPYQRVASGIVPSSWIGSGMMRGLADSDGIAIVPAGGAAEGDRLRGLTLPWERRLRLSAEF